MVRLFLDKGGADPGRTNRCAMSKRLKSLFYSFFNINISQIRPDCGDGSGGGRAQGMRGSALGEEERRAGGPGEDWSCDM